MYWFNIFYYDNSPDMYVVPMNDVAGNQLLVYAATPEQASEMAWELINLTSLYQRHLGKIGTMSCAIRDEDMSKWHADHIC
jgi:hypothetical protein